MGHGKQSGREESNEIIKRDYEMVAQFGNIKVVRSLDGRTVAPLVTATKGRIYATLDGDNNIKYITFYDAEGEKTRQIDVAGRPHNGIKTPHIHEGYDHDLGTKGISGEGKNKDILEKTLQAWSRKRKQLGL